MELQWKTVSVLHLHSVFYSINCILQLNGFILFESKVHSHFTIHLNAISVCKENKNKLILFDRTLEIQFNYYTILHDQYNVHACLLQSNESFLNVFSLQNKYFIIRIYFDFNSSFVCVFILQLKSIFTKNAKNVEK